MLNAASKADLRKIRDDQIATVYRRFYWDAVVARLHVAAEVGKRDTLHGGAAGGAVLSLQPPSDFKTSASARAKLRSITVFLLMLGFEEPRFLGYREFFFWGGIMKFSQIAALTSLRFFAAASIFVYHAQVHIFGINHPQLALGVSFFFVLSGFVLTYAYRDLRWDEIGDFYFARFARIWPVHAVTFVAAAVFLTPSFFSVWSGIIGAINISLLQAWVPYQGVVFSFNAASWSISAEMAFYALFPALLLTRRFGSWYFALAAVTVLIVGALAALRLPGPTSPWTFNPISFAFQFPLSRVLEFATGVFAGRLYVTGRAANVKGTVFEVGSLVSVLIFAVFSQCLIPWLSQSGGMFFFAAAIFVFAREAGKISKALSWPPLVRLGEISFSTYMLHDLILRIAVTHGLVQRIGKPWSVLLIVPLVYVLSYVMWAGVEVRFRKILMGMRNSRVATQLVPGQ